MGWGAVGRRLFGVPDYPINSEYGWAHEYSGERLSPLSAVE